MAGGFGSFYFFVIFPVSNALHGEQTVFHVAMLFASVPIGFLFLAMGGLCAWGILLSFTVYSIDDHRILAVGPVQNTSLEWRGIDSIHISWTSITLTGNGKSMRIYKDVVSDARGELAAAITSKLSALLDRQLHAPESGTKRYRPMRMLTVPAGIGALFFIAFGIATIFKPGVPGDTMAALITLEILLGLLAAGAAAAAIYASTFEIVVSPTSIASISAFQKKIIPFDRITSVMNRTVATKGGDMRVTTVDGGGSTITLTDRMEDYDTIAELLARKAKSPALQAGQSAVPAVERKERRQSLAILSVLSIIGMGGFSLWAISVARSRIARDNQILQAGAHTQATVTGAHMSGGRSRSYVIDFEFQASGKGYHGSSPVSRNEYYTARAGDSIPIAYLPSNPALCRITTSTARAEDEKLLWLACVMLAVSLALPVIFRISTLRPNLPPQSAGRHLGNPIH